MKPTHLKPRLLLASAVALAVWIGCAGWLTQRRHDDATARAVAEASARSVQEAEAMAKHVGRDLAYLRGIPATFSQVQRVQKALQRFDAGASSALTDAAARRRHWTREPALDELNRFFAHSVRELHADLLFVVNAAGDCIVSSNADTPESLVGANFSDREYFRAARQGRFGRQYATGRRTGIAGLFYSAPVAVDGHRLGVVVVKMNTTSLSYWLEQSHAFVVDDLGVVIMARDKRYEFHVLADAPFNREAAAERTSRYRMADLPALSFRPLDHPRYPGIVRLNDDTVPVALASRALPDEPVQVFALHPIPELEAIGRTHIEFFLFLIVIGTLTIAVVTGGYYYLARRRQVAAELQASEARFRALFENSPVAYQSLNENGCFLDVNDRLCEMLGYAREELLGRSFGDLLAPEVRSGFPDMFADFIAKGDIQGDLILLRKDGERVYAIAEGQVQRDRDGRFVRTHCVLHDISVRIRAEEALASLNATLARRVAEETAKSLQRERLLIEQSRHAAMGEMIGNIAHQWRQPLAVLGLLIQNLRYDFREERLTEPDLEGYVAKAMRAIEQMSTTIDDFRNFFKPSRRAERFCVLTAIEDCLALVSASLRNGGIEGSVIGARAIELTGYPSEFAQIMLNLITNAKDALLERQAAAGRIEIAVASTDKGIVVTVSDNAGGIAAEDLERIFDPYFTTKEMGTGIGLYMTRTIVEQHMHGTIRAENSGAGAQFTINLPGNQTGEP